MKKILLAFFSVFLLSCTQQNEKLQAIEGLAFGTTYHIQYYGSAPEEIQKGVDSVIDAINQSASTYIKDSDISRINNGDSTVVVDAFFKEVFKLSDRIHKESQGFFDPTVGVLRNAYGFGEENPLMNLDTQTLDSLMKFVGFHKVRLNDNGTIFKESPEIYIDFNAIAKGAGVDYVGKYLDSKDLTDYLIEIGGEILAKGQNKNKNSKWTVGIEKPDSELTDRSYEAAIQLENQALAASGNYRKFRVDETTGKKYVHTINPLTGSAEMSDVTSATVVAKTCAEADAYATALMAMGFEKAKKLLLENNKIDAYLTYLNEDGTQQVYMTNGFRNLLVK